MDPATPNTDHHGNSKKWKKLEEIEHINEIYSTELSGPIEMLLARLSGFVAAWVEEVSYMASSHMFSGHPPSLSDSVVLS